MEYYEVAKLWLKITHVMDEWHKIRIISQFQIAVGCVGVILMTNWKTFSLKEALLGGVSTEYPESGHQQKYLLSRVN